MERKRKLQLCICDYANKVVCDLYDNQSDISGQAANVFIDTERNGWKELSFEIPSTCMGEDGIEENYRLKYLIAEYKIRAIDDYGTDWFIISEPQINRNAFSKNVTVKAGHISQLLKHKNLDLEFSDEEGNNVATADRLLATILEGTGWQPGYVEEFKDDDGNIKIRSLTASASTGALALIEKLCDVFEAKPIYHGDTKTVDLISMNPFANTNPEDIPAILRDDETQVLELYYDRNVHTLQKTANTENMATRLYAYGSVGDMNGMCSLQNALHNEWTFTVTQVADEYCFVIGETKYFFIGNVAVGDMLIWSDMDITSMTYIYNDTQKYAYRVYKKPILQYEYLEQVSVEEVKNEFAYLLGLKYYDDVGLMTETQFQEIATFQRVIPEYLRIIQEKSELFVKGEDELSKIAEHSNGLLKLKIDRVEEGTKIYIDTTGDNHGVIYRTDYEKAERRYFKWHVTDKLNEWGDPVTGTPSLLFIVHDTDPATYTMTYLKSIWNSYGDMVVDEEGNPADFEYSTGDYPIAFTVWNEVRLGENDRVYLFCTNAMEGLLGARLAHIEAVYQDLYSLTMRHPVTFHKAGTPVPSPTDSEYEWRYDYYDAQNGELYFCWKDKFNESTWHRVYVSDTQPNANDGYWFNTRHRLLFRYDNGWVKIEDKQITVSMFESVIYYCNERDKLFRGIYEYYFRNGALDVGNYGIFDGYNTYWAFKLKDEAEENILLDYIGNGRIYPDVETEQGLPVFIDGKPQFSADNIVTSQSVETRYVFYPSENELLNRQFYPGSIDLTNGTEYTASSLRYRTGDIPISAGTTYSYYLPLTSVIYLYDDEMTFIRSIVDTTTPEIMVGDFNSGLATNMRVVVPQVVSTSYIKEGVSLNILDNRPFVDGDIDSNGNNKDTDRYRTGTIQVYESTEYEYNLTGTSFLYFYDINLNYISGISLGTNASGTFTTPPNAFYMRVVDSLQQPSGYIRIVDYDKKFYMNREAYVILDSVVGLGELIGITPLVKRFADIADETYEDYLANLQNAQEEVKTRENALAVLLDDMLKDGRWQDSNYIYGDEKRLYDDAMYMLKQIAFPEITYSFTYLDMYGAELNLCECDREAKLGADWPDILITYVAHLIDPESNTNSWAYIDKINKCYDQPWRTAIEIDTKLTLAARHNFTDVIARIADVAKEIKAKQSLYDRAATGNIEGSRLEGVISLNQTILNGGSSNWFNDEKGNLVFEAADGQSAMLLGGRGLGVATSKSADGEWEWRTAATGYGLTADAVTAGYIDADRIDAGTITLSKLASNVGKELEIGSNKALLLYATQDGTRPAGSLKTTDGYIEIAAGSESVPAKINIVSGGELNLNGGDVHIYSEGELDVSSGGKFTLKSNGCDSMNSTANGLFIDSEQGINFGGGRFKVEANGTSSNVRMVAGYIALGTAENNKATVLRMDNAVGKIDILADNEININSGNSITLTSGGGNVIIGNNNKPFTIGSDTYVVDQETSYPRAYIYNGRTGIFDELHDGVYLGTDGINVGTVGTGYIIATAAGDVAISGTVYATAGEIGSWMIGNTLYSYDEDPILGILDSSYVSLGASGDYRIWAGSQTASSAPFSVKKDGTLKASKGNVGGWYIGNDYIGNQDTKNYSTVGMAYVPSGTNIVFWAGNRYDGTGANVPKFWVKSDGSISATLGTVGGWYIGSDYIGNASTKANSTVCIASYGLLADDNSKVFWAGGTNNPNFYITKGGKLYASGAEITGNSTFAGALSAATGTFAGTVSAGAVIACNISANNIVGGTLTLGGNNNTSGVLSIKDANGNVIGSWNNLGITATAGEIGGWTIATNSLHSGSGSTYVELNSNPSSSFAILVGSSTDSNASFKVKRTGEVYLTKLIIQKENNSGSGGTYTTEELNLTSNSNRLRGGTILGWKQLETGQTTLYTTYGDVTFNGATTLSGEWGGAYGTTYTVTATPQGNEESTTVYLEVEVGGFSLNPNENINAKIYKDRPGVQGNQLTVKHLTLIENVESKTVTLISEGDTSNVKGSISTAATYNAGWDYALTQRSVSAQTAGSSEIAIKTLTYDEKWKIIFTIPNSSGVNQTSTYVVKAPVDNYNTGYSEGSPKTNVSLGSKVSGVTDHVYNCTITRNDNTTVGGTINLNQAYADARTGYTLGTFTAVDITLQGSSDSVFVEAASGGTNYYTAGTVISGLRRAGSAATYYDVGSNTTLYKGNGTRLASVTRYDGTGPKFTKYWTGVLYYYDGEDYYRLPSAYWYTASSDAGSETYGRGSSESVYVSSNSGGYYLRGDSVTPSTMNVTLQGTAYGDITPISSTRKHLLATTRYKAGTRYNKNMYYTKS